MIKKRNITKIKSLFCILFCLMLPFMESGMVRRQVKAEEAVHYDVSAGDVVISADGDYIITGHTEMYTIQIEKDVNANITLDNVSVTTESGAAPFMIADNSSGNVTVTLQGENKLTSNGVTYAALQKNGSGEGIGTLTIQGEGSLTATGGGEAAAIGGGGGSSGDHITISGGMVTAIGGYWAAGIGGGRGCSGSNITINGGTVTATGGNLGAGIGGGSTGAGSYITIHGGMVTANGGTEGAGIGGGNEAVGNNISINGGIVTANTEDGRTGIDGTDSQTDWNGLVVQNGAGLIYGDSLELTSNFTVFSGDTLEVKENQTLTIASGVTLTVAGTIANSGTIVQHGEIAIDGTGSISGNVPQKEATGISLNKNNMTLFVDDTGTLTAATSPTETYEKVKWSCDNEEVITLETNETNASLTAKKAGKATVTAAVGEFRVTCEVVVKKLTGTATVRAEDIYYGSSPVIEKVSSNGTENAIVEYKNLDADNAVYMADVPEKPGNYSVRAVFPETDKYTKAEATADFKITYLPLPEQPYKLSGTKGKNGFYISFVKITPPQGYLISASSDGTYGNAVTFQTSKENANVYLMNGRNEKTDAVPVGSFKIDTRLPVIGAKDKSVSYGDTVEVIVSDTNLSHVMVNGSEVEFSGTSAKLLLESGNGKKEYEITATDLAGNKNTVNITVAASWLKSGVVPNGTAIRLTANQRYMLGSGTWKVSGDSTNYTGTTGFYVGSEGEYIFTKQ